MMITAGKVHLWVTRDRDICDVALVRRYETIMSAEERGRADRFYFPEHRRQFVISRALLRDVLSRYAPSVAPAAWRFVRGEHGRPYIASPPPGAPLHFSLSHCEGMIALAVSGEDQLGVDVEHRHRRPVEDPPPQRFFASSELAHLRADQPGRMDRFLEIWTLKEAYLKALGMGLSGGLDTVRFSFHETGELRARMSRPSPDAAGRWRFRQFAVGADHLAALAMWSAAADATFDVDAFLQIPLLAETEPLRTALRWRDFADAPHTPATANRTMA